MKKLFFGIEMKWWKVIAFAAAAGVVTGILMQLHALDGTSLQNIGISYEAWILFAVIICMNCQKPTEAALKTFVFFLISQPLVYLTMWPEYHRFPWEYYRFWGIMTVLTLPGGFIAWYVKKKTMLSALILSVACVFLAFLGVDYLRQTLYNFPHHLLTVLFCFAVAGLFIAVLLPGKRERIVATAITIAATAVFAATALFGSPRSVAGYPMDNAKDYTFTVEDSKIVSVEPTEDGISITANGYGSTVITATAEDGTVVLYRVTVERNGLITLEELS